SSPFVKDAFHEYVIHKKSKAVNPEKTGTKAAAHYVLEIPAGGAEVLRLRLTKTDSKPLKAPIQPDSFDRIMQAHIDEADEFYDRITASKLKEDERRIFRQALAGMLWSKQYYYFDLDRWLDEHHAHPLLGNSPRAMRNTEWFHMLNSDIIS